MIVYLLFLCYYKPAESPHNALRNRNEDILHTITVQLLQEIDFILSYTVNKLISDNFIQISGNNTRQNVKLVRAY